jgi:DNA (cytosine-5)-methyltransferase 1
LTFTMNDYYCCEGGASRGYALAGLRINLGVDIFKYKDAAGRTKGFSQQRYPYPSVQTDAISHILTYGHLTDFNHGSPPCQRYSITANGHEVEHPDLVGPTREAFIETGKPYIIENVVGAPLIDPIELCGCMFDLVAEDTDGVLLHLWRPRLFESNMPLVQPIAGNYAIPRGSGLTVHDPAYHAYEHVAGSYGGARRQGSTPAERRYNAKKTRGGGYVPDKSVQEKLLGIDWMTVGGLHQSLPPVYTHYLGRQVIRYLEGWSQLT